MVGDRIQVSERFTLQRSVETIWASRACLRDTDDLHLVNYVVGLLQDVSDAAPWPRVRVLIAETEAAALRRHPHMTPQRGALRVKLSAE